MTALMGPQPGTGVVNVRDFLARRRGVRARDARIYMTGQILVGVAGWGGRPLADLVRGTQRHSSGPGFDSSWERISG